MAKRRTRSRRLPRVSRKVTPRKATKVVNNTTPKPKRQ